MRISPTRMTTLAALLASACWGCGPAGSGTLPDLILVKGRVTYKGKPLSSGTIRFEPDGFGRTASGKLKEDGTFVLSTLKEGDGVVRGHHFVSISETGKSVRKEIVPSKYTSPNTSKLEADVDSEHTEFTFDLQ
jgi:hypothetical protein